MAPACTANVVDVPCSRSTAILSLWFKYKLHCALALHTDDYVAKSRKMLLRRSLAQCDKEGYESHATNVVSLFLVFSCGLLSSLVLVCLFGGNFLPVKEQLTARYDHSFEPVPQFDEALVQVVTESYTYEYQERSSRKTGDEVINRSQNRALQTPFHLGFNIELDDEPTENEKEGFPPVPTTELIRLEKHKSSKVSMG